VRRCWGVVMASAKKPLEFSAFAEINYTVIRRPVNHVIVTCLMRLLPVRQVAWFRHAPEL
jgi:hypothetical protein